MRPATFAIAEKGGFINRRSDHGRIEVIVDLAASKRVAGTAGKREVSTADRVSASSSARARRRDLGQDGEEAGSGEAPAHGPRPMAAAVRATRPRGLVWKMLEASLSAERRCGSEKAGDLVKAESREAGESALRTAPSVFAEEEDGRGLAGVIGRLPVQAPEASEAPKAASMAVRRIAASTRCRARMWEEKLGGGDDIAATSGRWTGDGCALVGRDWRKVVHEGSLGRAGIGEPGALSLGPHRLKPVPAALFLSSRRRLHGAPHAIRTSRSHSPTDAGGRRGREAAHRSRRGRGRAAHRAAQQIVLIRQPSFMFR